MNPFNQQYGIPMYNNQKNRPVTCCGVIHYSIGLPLVLTSWIGISVYFATLSFMGKNPFYSHFNKSAIIVFGVLNIIFAVVCCCGYSLLIKRSLYRYRQYAKLLACCVAAIILDMFANFILFCIKKDDFQTWCQTTASHNLNLQFQNQDVLDQSINNSTILFNCSKLFKIQAEFSFACMVMMIIVYAYWVSFIIEVSRNFILLRPEIQIHQHSMRQQQQQSGLMRMQQQQQPMMVVPQPDISGPSVKKPMTPVQPNIAPVAGLQEEGIILS